MLILTSLLFFVVVQLSNAILMGYHGHLDFTNLICTQINIPIFTGIEIFKDMYNDFLNVTLHHIINICAVLIMQIEKK